MQSISALHDIICWGTVALPATTDRSHVALTSEAVSASSMLLSWFTQLSNLISRPAGLTLLGILLVAISWALHRRGTARNMDRN